MQTHWGGSANVFFVFKETIHKGSTSKVTSIKEESTTVCPSVLTLRTNQ